ncbi:class I SAM-dependent methyltransferase [Ktedonobacter robiniae]|uniref:Methyltransferase domain-containing protein n=1 Tax=Ktedonobacter robiniae TaxID=2778365 RepID=A0ABQ3UPY5_9CHLR|nr:class I SAM-dependent methyltransferase [Ktedonobacter robiniae]GHO54662.1 hypothetical protein KSB_31370 [Ktedonobacter robiniae]
MESSSGTSTYSQTWFDVFMPTLPQEHTKQDVAFLGRMLPLPRYRRVLDLCCGYGRHALPLADRGYEVTGVDRDIHVIAEAQRRAAGRKISYLVGDMRELEQVSGNFDAVINMWQSFSYFDEATNRDLLRQIHAKLASQGRLIIDMFHREFYEQHQGVKHSTVNGMSLVTRQYMQGRRLLVDLEYGNGETDHFEWELFTPAEFSAIVAASGFRTLLTCTWSDEARPATAEIPRMQMVFEKI